MAVTLYGIPNCDTVKKARTWLAGRGIDYAFHDYKKQGIEAKRIAGWIERAGLDRVLNTAGTTYKALPDAVKAGMTGDTAPALMAANPSCIKRPIVEHDGGLLVGFKPDEWERAFAG